VKYPFLILVCSAISATAQSSASSSSTDINGNRLPGVSTVSGDHQITEVSQSINGSRVPLEQSSSKVLSEDSNGKVVETILRKYNQTGQLVSTERVVTEEQKRGSDTTTRTTTYRSDINGNMSQAERKVVESATQGGVTNTQTVIERPSVNGSMQAVEKRSLVSQAAGENNIHSDETVYRLSGNGGYYPALREITDTAKEGNQTTAKTQHYEQISGSELQLTRQSVSTVTKRPDGSEVEQVNLYGNAVPGNVRENGSPLQLFEQQIIDREKGPGDTVVQTLSVRRPTMSNPNTLGPVQRISETTCKGNCDPKKP
jgi:hypothetical protein